MVTIEAVGFKPRWSLILEMNFPLPVWVLCTKMIFAPEWSNARNGIYMTKSRTSFNKQLLDYWIFIKGMHHWRGSLCLSSSNGHHEQGKFARIKSEKNKHTCLALMSRFILSSLENFSKRINLEWKFQILTCVNQCRLLELLSYGDYNQVSISDICFLKRTRLSFHRFQLFIYFFSFRKTSTYIIFLLLNNGDHINSVLKHWIIYTWINFSLGYLCCEINFGRTKNLKIARSFCAKVF